MLTFTLEPSFNGLTTTGNFNLLLISLISCKFFLSNEYVKNFGVFTLYFINNFLDNGFSKNSIKNLSNNDLSLFDEILDYDDQKLYDFIFKNQPIGNKDHESFIIKNLKTFTEQGNF